MTTRTRQKLLAAFFGMMWFAQSFAVTITVNSTADTVVADAFTTLREAIIAANATMASDTIEFNIPGAPGTVHTISLGSALPNISNPVIIDGYSQLGATENTLAVGSNAFLAIVIDGIGAGAAVSGLSLGANGSTIQGLVIHNFTNAGILISSDGNTIRGNFIGTDQAGLLDRGNDVGIAIRSAEDNLIGGTALGDRNLISGNEVAGVSIIGATSSNNQVQNNLIGTDKTAIAAIANTGDGVVIFDAADNTVGGTLPSTGNVIAFNGDDGVALTSTALSGNRIARNSIHSNGELGIDLTDNGVTANDTDDPDVGPNGLQNFPVLSEATSNVLGTTIEGTLNSLPNTKFRIEFFSNTAADPSGFGEGEVFLGFVDVTTNASGDAAFSFDSAVVLAQDTLVTATATAPNNSTSEFSEALLVVITPPAIGDNDDDDDGGEDDDELVPFPVPVPPPLPFPPLEGPIADVPVVAAPVVAPHAVLPVDKAPKVEYEITVDGLQEGLTSSESAERAPRAAASEESGCSTAGGSFGLLWGVLIGLYTVRRKIQPKC